MSVQAGVWNFDGKPVDGAFLDKLASAIEQYGPDGGHTYINGSTAMTYRGFHTTLESRLERQPYVTSRGLVMTWDGRLDNRDELILQLSEGLTVDRTDVAIVAAAFELSGADCFCRLIGDWAISIWKPLERELLFACDYMSIRHIFYCMKEDRIWWSTDLTPLVLLSDDKFHIDDDYLAGYFANDPEPHLTPYREIRQVPPGQFVRVRNGMVQVERFWRISPKSRIRYKTDAEYEEHFRHVYRQSVRRRLRSDSPIIAELSGGLDSSSIVCMADNILAKEGAETPRLDTLSYDDPSEPHGDDRIYRKKVEEKRGRVGCQIDASRLGSSPAPLSYSQFFPLPGYLGYGRQLEIERADIIRNGNYRVSLSGIGGDEFMGGIPDPRAQLADHIMHLNFVRLAKELITWSMIKRKPWIQLLFESVMEFLPPGLGRHLIADAKVAVWLEESFAKRTRLAALYPNRGEYFGFLLPTRRSYIAGVLLMSNRMAKGPTPQPTMGEARYPYLDQDLIKFILSIPASQLLRPGERRSLMRRALVGCVPPEILTRRTKQGSARTPVMALSNSWKELGTTFDCPLVCSSRYVHYGRLLEVLEAVRTGKSIHLVMLQRTISLEFWLRDVVSRHLLDVAAGLPANGASEPARAWA